MESLPVRGTILPDEDTDAPTVTVSTRYPVTPPVSGPINVLVEFSEAVTGLELSELEVTNGSAASIAKLSRTKWLSRFDVYIVPDEGLNGNVSIRVPAGVATDALGNSNTASEPFVIAARGHDSLRTEGLVALQWIFGPRLLGTLHQGNSVGAVRTYWLLCRPCRLKCHLTDQRRWRRRGRRACGLCALGPVLDLTCHDRIDIQDGMTGQLTLQVLAGAAS